ncbi:hypothetical protein F5887DRAFT_1081931 [Amanita rubescens]|nr:hypothetical protein F5887DRAFT_1081931 [Amanita rubescens]
MTRTTRRAPNRKTTISKLPSTSAAPPQEQESQMESFTLITMLLRLAVTLRHQNGDISMRTGGSSIMEPQKQWDDRINFSTMDAFSAILTLDHGVVAVCYESEEPLKVEIVVGVTTCGSPDLKTNAERDEVNPSGYNVRFITSGTDYWPEIKESDILNVDPLGYLGSCNAMDPGSHAKTVCAYLNDYRLGDQTAREDYSAKFWNYLFSVSWKKMHGRMASWSGRGFIDTLDRGWKNVCVNTYPKWEEISKGSGDESLAMVISNTQRNHDLVFWLQLAYPESAKPAPFLGTLIQSIESGQLLFSQRTAADYHKLVIATFIVVGSILESMDRSHRTWNGPKKRDPNAKAALKRLKNFTHLAQWFTRLLLSILASASFREYILFMTHEGIDHLIPRSSCETLYMAEWKQRVLSVPDTNGGPNSDIEESSNNDSTDASVLDIDLEVDSSNIEVASENLDAGSTEVLDMGHSAEALLQWMRTFVLPFLGKRILENKCEDLEAKHPGSEVRISVLATDHIQYFVPPWDKFVPYIESALKGCPANGPSLDEVIATIRTELGEGKQYGPAHRDSIVPYFKDLLFPSDESDQETPTISLSVHCESALTSLSQHYYDAIKDQNDTDLIDACKKLYTPMIAVSKLCCLACWELLEVLRKDGDVDPSDTSPKFVTRGFHSHVYPTVLPPWIQPQQKEQMISKFQSYLGSELVVMVSALKKIHSAKPQGWQDTSAEWQFRHYSSE